MELTVGHKHGQDFVEGTPGQSLLQRVDDVTLVIEACFAHQVNRLLLYDANLTEHFFDLSSREAGAILQKLRTYQIRLAIVGSPSLQLSSRFGELLADELRGPYFRLFDTRLEAEDWLCLG